MPYVWDQNGQRYEEPETPLAEQHKYYNSHPPLILAAYTLSPLEEADLSFGGHGEIINKGYLVNCPCGSPKFSVSAIKSFYDNGQPFWEGPVSLRCEACGNESVVFDERKHGYDGEYGNNDWMDRASESFEQAGFARNHEILAFVFHYTDEGFTFDNKAFIEGGDNGKPRPENTFTWLSIIAFNPTPKPEKFLSRLLNRKRKGDPRIRHLLDFECA